MYHYVYRISNIILNKHYYGVRTSKVHPIKDLGIKYFSSSTDVDFIQDQKLNHQHYKYKIVSLHNSRKRALQQEIKLHSKFDVGANESFYNKVKQTSTGFCTQNAPFTSDKKKRWSDAAKRREQNKSVEQKLKTSQRQSDAYHSLADSEKQRRINKQKQNLDYATRDIARAKTGTYNYYRIYNDNDIIVFEGLSKDYLQWLKDNNAPYSSFQISFENQCEIVGYRRRLRKCYEQYRGYWVSKIY